MKGKDTVKYLFNKNNFIIHTELNKSTINYFHPFARLHTVPLANRAQRSTNTATPRDVSVSVSYVKGPFVCHRLGFQLQPDDALVT